MPRTKAPALPKKVSMDKLARDLIRGNDLEDLTIYTCDLPGLEEDIIRAVEREYRLYVDSDPEAKGDELTYYHRIAAVKVGFHLGLAFHRQLGAGGVR